MVLTDSSLLTANYIMFHFYCWSFFVTMEHIKFKTNDNFLLLDHQLILFAHLPTGRALVIFRSKDAAENAISELTRRCLVLEGGRYFIYCFVFLFYFVILFCSRTRITSNPPRTSWKYYKVKYLQIWTLLCPNGCSIVMQPWKV
jgi:hypothetical protein